MEPLTSSPASPAANEPELDVEVPFSAAGSVQDVSAEVSLDVELTAETPSTPMIELPAVRQEALPSPRTMKTEMPRTGRALKPATSAVEAAPKSQASVDSVARAADGACAGMSVAALEMALINNGMDWAAAQAMAKSMLAAHAQVLDKHQNKAAMWLGFVGGLVLTTMGAVSAAILSTGQTQKNPSTQWMAIGVVAVGVLLLLRGVWRFFAGRRPIRAEKVLAVWRESNSQS
jgi:hypothetical protein